MDSRGEIEKMEANRALAVGFSLSTAGLLATPVDLGTVFADKYREFAVRYLGEYVQRKAGKAAK